MAAQRQRTRGIAQAFHIEAGYLLLESTRPQQDLRRGDARAIEIQLRPMLAVHEARRLPHDEARCTALDQYRPDTARSEEHTSELQSLMRISYAVFCLKKKKQ